jgi:hypothetical protein
VTIGISYEDLSHTKNANTVFTQFLRKHYQARLAEAVQVGHWKGYPISYSYTWANFNRLDGSSSAKRKNDTSRNRRGNLSGHVFRYDRGGRLERRTLEHNG